MRAGWQVCIYTSTIESMKYTSGAQEVRTRLPLKYRKWGHRSNKSKGSEDRAPVKHRKWNPNTARCTFSQSVPHKIRAWRRENLHKPAGRKHTHTQTRSYLCRWVLVAPCRALSSVALDSAPAETPTVCLQQGSHTLLQTPPRYSMTHRPHTDTALDSSLRELFSHASLVHRQPSWALYTFIIQNTAAQTFKAYTR